MTTEERLIKKLERSERKVQILEKMIEETSSKLYKANQELKRQNSELEQFAYLASHDLKQPLRTIASYSKLLSRKYKGNLDGSADLYLKFMTDSAFRMTSLIDDLLKISTINKSVEKESIDLNILVENVLIDINSLVKEKGAQITFGVLPIIESSKTQIYQIFQNLISNAIKYSEVHVVPQVKITAEDKLKYWLFKVQDNGIGVDPRFKEQIFDIFKQLNVSKEYNGSGIGLSQVKKIVELHGGKIWVESSLKQGSIFYFTLLK